MKEEKKFKPYVPANKSMAEITGPSVIMGVLLAVVFGAANAYLGLRVGMTVSASIPAAVVSMGVIRVLMGRNSILESNMVQTIGSAGESLAAGAIFTLPALFLWAAEGKMAEPGIGEIALITVCGGILGVLFMIPLRGALIVKEHDVLPYPEGTACAEVLLAGEKGGAGAGLVFAGMGISAAIKFIVDGMKVLPGEFSVRVRGYAGEIGSQVYPALLGVGFICGPKISSYLFAGGVTGWLVLIPLIVTFGGNAVLYPGTESIGAMYEAGGAGAIWGSYIRYIGAGAVAAGGIMSLIKSLPLIGSTFAASIKGLKESGSGAGQLRTERDLDSRVMYGGILLMILSIWLLPAIPVSFAGAAIVVVFGFFFAAVSSRMVGLVGSSNNPVSGMAIATLLIATVFLKMSGNRGIQGMQGAIAIGAIICIIACMAGDTSQDLKTGYLLGATPKKQQIGELIGTVAAALTIGGTLFLLHGVWGFGSAEIPAPQATLMKMIVEGVMDGNLPWALVIAGAFLAVVMEILGVPVLPFAVGLYLPVQLSGCIMIGGLVRLYLDKKKAADEERNRTVNNGVLYCSGMIAGEGVVGILLALLTGLEVNRYFDFSRFITYGQTMTVILGAVVLLVLCGSILAFSLRSGRQKVN